MDTHLTNELRTDNTKQAWLSDDARLFLQIRDSIYTEIVTSNINCMSKS